MWNAWVAMIRRSKDTGIVQWRHALHQEQNQNEMLVYDLGERPAAIFTFDLHGIRIKLAKCSSMCKGKIWRSKEKRLAKSLKSLPMALAFSREKSYNETITCDMLNY